MEKCKEPAMVLSMINSLGLVGAVTYFYKQNEAAKIEIARLSESIKSLSNRIHNIEKGEQTKAETMLVLNNKVRELGGVVEDITNEDLENLENDVKEIIGALEENDINVNIEKPSTGGKRRGSSKQSSRRTTDDERKTDSRRRSVKQQTPRKENLSYEEDDLDIVGQMRRRQN